MATFLLIFFLLFFPKGGFKIGEVPITWGYLLLAIVAAMVLLHYLFYKKSISISKNRLLAIAVWLPFQLISAGTFFLNGVEGIGFTLSFFITFFFLPLTFIFLFGISIDNHLDLNFAFDWIKKGILFVACYGIFLFFYKLITKEFIEIPFLTLNYGDMGKLEDKHIDRGGIFKLISTYNNGNLYGICILMLLPLYTFLEKKHLRIAVVKFSLLLSLSRTVWMGLILFEIISRFSQKKLSPKMLLYGLACLILLSFSIVYAVILLGFDLAFLFDSSLGGRFELFSNDLRSVELLSDEQFISIFEMVYLSILRSFGVIGLLFFLLAISFPLCLQLTGVVSFSNTRYKKSLSCGLFIYLVIAAIDGGILFIPTMVFFFFLCSLLLSNNSSFMKIEHTDALLYGSSQG